MVDRLSSKIDNYIFKDKNIEIDIKVKIAINNVFPILENADLILKKLKKINDQYIGIYDDSMNLKQNIEENMNMVLTIKNALKDDRIVPYFQPIIDLQQSKIIKYEALVRLKLEDGKILSPFMFLEISKKSNLYHEITKVMIIKVLETAKKYPQYRFSLNLSMIDIADTNFLKMFFDTFSSNLEIVKQIDIELLESEHLENLELVKEFIDKVHKMGCNILLDDFGTGYSNFSYFSTLDIDIVKIDASIVKEITTNKRKYHMLKSIKQFANGLNMKTISEFVENKEIAVALKEMGAAYAQGYYFSAPLEKPLDDDKVEI